MQINRFWDNKSVKSEVLVNHPELSMMNDFTHLELYETLRTAYYSDNEKDIRWFLGIGQWKQVGIVLDDFAARYGERVYHFIYKPMCSAYHNHLTE